MTNFQDPQRKIVIIVQARMTSSRLPGKVMLPLGDKTVLGQVLSRCWQIEGIDEVCCAIPLGSEHTVLEKEIQKYHATLFRGSELDVLERYYKAALYTKADFIMRITSDCPLIDPLVSSQLIKNLSYPMWNMRVIIYHLRGLMDLIVKYLV